MERGEGGALLVGVLAANTTSQEFKILYPFGSSDLTYSVTYSVAVLKNYTENAPIKVMRRDTFDQTTRPSCAASIPIVPPLPCSHAVFCIALNSKGTKWPTTQLPLFFPLQAPWSLSLSLRCPCDNACAHLNATVLYHHCWTASFHLKTPLQQYLYLGKCFATQAKNDEIKGEHIQNVTRYKKWNNVCPAVFQWHFALF